MLNNLHLNIRFRYIIIFIIIFHRNNFIMIFFNNNNNIKSFFIFLNKRFLSKRLFHLDIIHRYRFLKRLRLLYRLILF